MRIVDELDIERLLTRYCRAVDTKDWALYRSLFTADARVDYSAAGLVVGTVEEAVTYLSRNQDAISVGMHYLTTVESTVSGDAGRTIAMWFNAVALPDKDGISFFGGRWHDRLVRTAGGWRIDDLRLEVVA